MWQDLFWFVLTDKMLSDRTEKDFIHGDTIREIVSDTCLAFKCYNNNNRSYCIPKQKFIMHISDNILGGSVK